MSTSTRIYVACLASYNAGVLHGTWIDDPTAEECVLEEIKEMLAESKHSPAEEWAIHDHEGFGGIKIGEYYALCEVALHARMIGEHDGAWIAYVGNVGESHATEEGFSNDYRGHYPSAAEYAESLHEDCGTNLGHLADYIDWERYARDLGFDGYAFVDDGRGGVHVFSP